MTNPHIGLIVEGKGEKESVPLLLRRHLQSLNEYRVGLGKPIVTNGRSGMTKPGGIEGFVAAAVARPGCVATLIVADSDKDAVCKLGPDLLKRAQSITNKLVVVALAEKNFEDWLYASVETLELGEERYDPHESAMYAIKRLVRQNGGKYVKPIWQPRLTNRVDISMLAQRSTSFARLVQKTALILEE